LSYNSPETQELLWDMIHQAEMEYGFSAADSQLLIEAIAVSAGNFVITVTKVQNSQDFESIQKYIKNNFKRSDLKVKRKSVEIASNYVLYEFSSFDNICKLSSVLRNKYNGDNNLYKCNGTYYIMLYKSNSYEINFKHRCLAGINN
jgi:adapter protein MecA 1/2